MEEEKENLLNS